MTVRFLRLAVVMISLSFLPLTGRAQDGTGSIRPHEQLNLMPVPASIKSQPGRLRITSNFTVGTQGFSDDRLRSGIARMISRLAGRTVLSLPYDLATDANAPALVIQCDRAGESIPSISENESYRLEIGEKQARLTAPTVVGALRGMETILQLLKGDREGYYLPAVIIQDQPRFPWPGLLIDVGRHFEPMEVLKRNLDAMAAVKLNVFHWHLTEDQGFRVRCRRGETVD